MTVEKGSLKHLNIAQSSIWIFYGEQEIHISRSSEYRYINAYDMAADHLPNRMLYGRYQ